MCLLLNLGARDLLARRITSLQIFQVTSQKAANKQLPMAWHLLSFAGSQLDRTVPAEWQWPRRWPIMINMF